LKAFQHNIFNNIKPEKQNLLKYMQCFDFISTKCFCSSKGTIVLATFVYNSHMSFACTKSDFLHLLVFVHFVFY